MSWFKVDDKLWGHPKVIAAGNAAMGLWLRAGSYSAQFETDGRLNLAQLSPLSCRKRDIDRLVEVGLWERVDGGIQFKDWADYQPTKAQKDADRAATRERVNRHRNGVTPPVSNGASNGVSNGAPVPSRPDPVTSNEVTTSPPTPSKRETRLSAKWQPRPEHLKRSNELGLDLLVELEKFRNHAATHERTAKNWNAAFTNWLIRAGEYAARDRERGRRSTYQERQAEMWDREMAAAKARDEVMFGADQRANAHNPALLEGR